MLRPSEPPHPGLGTVLIATAGKGVKARDAAATARALTPAHSAKAQSASGHLSLPGTSSYVCFGLKDVR